jgi:hypothetical protein
VIAFLVAAEDRSGIEPPGRGPDDIRGDAIDALSALAPPPPAAA